MSSYDLDREILNQDTDFILGTILAGWVLGLALCTTILMLAAPLSLSITLLVLSDSTELNVSSIISSKVTAFDSTAPDNG